MSLVVERLPNIPAQHQESWRTIYEASFPAAERVDSQEYLACVANGTRWCFGALCADELVGFATIVPNIVPSIHLLEYLAIASSARNGGLGGVLFDHVMRELDADVLLEVESDDECAEHEHDLRQRRIRFYERHGARIVEGITCRAPCMDGDGVLPMKLMWWSAQHHPSPTGKNLIACVLGLYTRVYDLPLDHPLVRILSR